MYIEYCVNLGWLYCYSFYRSTLC